MEHAHVYTVRYVRWMQPYHDIYDGDKEKSDKELILAFAKDIQHDIDHDSMVDYSQFQVVKVERVDGQKADELLKGEF